MKRFENLVGVDIGGGRGVIRRWVAKGSPAVDQCLGGRFAVGLCFLGLIIDI